MKLTWFRRNAALTFGLLITCSATWILFSVQYFRTHWTTENSKELDQKAELWGRRMETDLGSLVQRSRWLVDAARESFASQENQLLFLKRNLAADTRLLAVTVYRKYLGVSQQKSKELRASTEWRPTLYLTRAKEDPDRLGSKEIEELDVKAPIHFDTVASTGADMRWADSVLRVAVQLGSEESIVLEIHAARWMESMADRSGTRAFLLSPEGALIWQTPALHAENVFHIGEDLRHLPIWEASQSALESGLKTGAMPYRPLPNLSEIRANYRVIEPGNALLITHAEPTGLDGAGQIEYLRVCVYLGFGIIVIYGGLFTLLNLNWIQSENKSESDSDSESPPTAKAA